MYEAPWLAELTKDLPSGVRPFQASDLHCTVAFLGPVGAAAAHRAFRALNDLTHPPFAPVVVGLRPFGPPNRPSAFSLALEEPSLNTWLQVARGEACRAGGVREDPRPVLPHVTVARPMRSANGAQIEEGKRWCLQAGPLPRRLKLATLALYTWSSERRARLFDAVVTRPLSGTASAGPG